MTMAVKEKSLYGHIAGLLDYPQEDIKLRAEECINALAAKTEYPPEALSELKAFQSELEMPLDDLQGIYSYTFELTADYTLDMGSYLYDGFKRSNSLAALKAMYRDNGFPFEEIAKGELPDHLPVLLRFAGMLENAELKADIMQSLVILSVEKLNKNFEKNRGNVYSHLIGALYKILEKDVKEVK